MSQALAWKRGLSITEHSVQELRHYKSHGQPDPPGQARGFELCATCQVLRCGWSVQTPFWHIASRARHLSRLMAPRDAPL
eukprot:4991883-Amphidinium_carterae.1